MGLLKAATNAISAVSGVAKTVLGVVAGAGKIGAGILSSKLGKFAFGAGALAILSSNPTGKEGGSLFSKLASGFKSFLGGIGATVAEKAGSAALGASAVVSGAGKAVNEAVAAVENDTSKTVGLEHVVATGSFDPPAPAETPAAPALEPAPAAEPAAVEASAGEAEADVPGYEPA